MAAFLDLLSSGSAFVCTIPSAFSWRLRFQTDDQLLPQAKRRSIESKIQELAKELGISKTIELIEKRNLATGAQAQGIGSFSSRIGIVIDPDLANALPEAELEFVLAHELSHIKANDNLWIGVFPSIAGVITTLAMSTLFPSLAADFSISIVSLSAVPGIAVSTIALFSLSKWREECADKLGFSACSCNAKKAAPAFFDRIRVGQARLRDNDVLKRFLFTEDGESRLDVLHPPLASRVQYLRDLNSQT